MQSFRTQKQIMMIDEAIAQLNEHQKRLNEILERRNNVDRPHIIAESEKMIRRKNRRN